MSDDVNKDIQKAIEDSQGSGNEPTGGVVIPPPNIVKHGLNTGRYSNPEWNDRKLRKKDN